MSTVSVARLLESIGRSPTSRTMPMRLTGRLVSPRPGRLSPMLRMLRRMLLSRLLLPTTGLIPVHRPATVALPTWPPPPVGPVAGHEAFCTGIVTSDVGKN